MSARPAGTCPAHDVWDRLVLPCIRPAGHDGDHHASSLRDLLPLAELAHGGTAGPASAHHQQQEKAPA